MMSSSTASLSLFVTVITLVVIMSNSCFHSAVAQNNNVMEQLVSSGFTELVNLISAADLNDTIASTTLTLFAPTNEAISNLPSSTVNELLNDNAKLTSLLSYHVLDGREVMSSDLTSNLTPETFDDDKKIRINIYDDNSIYTVNGKTLDLDNVDIEASNGVIHTLNGVLNPVDDNIAETLDSDEDRFSSLVTALNAANLTDTFVGNWESDNLYTVFAPNDDAFADLPSGTIQNLLDNPSEATNILTYHVVSGVYYSASLSDGMTVETAQGDIITISIGNNNGVSIDDGTASVVEADVTAENGVIHVIDGVLMPGENSASGTETGDSNGSVALSSMNNSLVVFVMLLLIMIVNIVRY